MDVFKIGRVLDVVVIIPVRLHYHLWRKIRNLYHNILQFVCGLVGFYP